MVERVVVLVDGDNISSAFGPRVLSAAKRHGCVQVARVFCDARTGTGWHDQDDVEVVHSGTGKNASDLLLSIHAMDLMNESSFHTFVIASSDSDFTHLMRRLRQSGAQVIGMGESKASSGFRQACTAFEELSAHQPKAPSTPTCATSSQPSSTDLKLRSLIMIHSTQGQGMAIVALAPLMHRQHKIKISSFPERTWRAYFNARPELFELDPKGPDAKVRFKPAAFPK